MFLNNYFLLRIVSVINPLHSRYITNYTAHVLRIRGYITGTIQYLLLYKQFKLYYTNRLQAIKIILPNAQYGKIRTDIIYFIFHLLFVNLILRRHI